MPTPASKGAEGRSIRLGDQQIAYQLRRSARRTIGLAIDARGLRVGAPLHARLGDIESLIRQHGVWILDKLQRWRERPLAERLAVHHGMTVFADNFEFTVTIMPGTRSRWQRDGSTLRLTLQAGSDPAPLLETALREIARARFSERLAHYAARLGVPIPPLRLSSARTRWGSCNARGQINLNWRLIWLPLPVIDYVVCHELAHLKEMNHSPRFWSVVELLCPDWRALRLELRQRGRQIPQL
ncbi:M48 family metallopeptidase [Dechloromonas sp.]|uniref:M48 family metallopeptidase n=1 Tax=Dechloromonas sp. TaxID=1917218 RepID=UPI0012251F56|nr:SprT family zinc-dependent metalloprotease [Dechloromonas sp.]MBU3697297.1 M48 family metallopeptidase [Dechloromonas sp.]TEX44427.1 MAG: metal-dependent hydrolase [Rhodocyclaceae bacterium]